MPDWPPHGGNAGVLVGGRLTVEDAYAYSKFARMVLGTNDIDFRARAHSAEEAEFLAAHIAGQPMTVTYTDLENAPAVLLAGLEPEEEVADRVPAAAQSSSQERTSGDVDRAVRHPAPGKMRGQLIATVPGGEGAALDALADDEHLKMPGCRHPGR